MRFKAVQLVAVLCMTWSARSLAGYPYQLTDLGSLGGGHSEAWSINDAGQIVGWAFNDSGEYRPMLFNPNEAVGNTDLGGIPGTSYLSPAGFSHHWCEKPVDGAERRPSAGFRPRRGVSPATRG